MNTSILSLKTYISRNNSPPNITLLNTPTYNTPINVSIVSWTMRLSNNQDIIPEATAQSMTFI